MTTVDAWRHKVVTPSDKKKSEQVKDATPPATARGADGRRYSGPQRPQSASLGGTDKLRPLGKAPQRFAAANTSKWEGTCNNMERGYITKLKTEILSLQRRADEISLKGYHGVSSEMSDLEQKLFHLQYDTDTPRLLKVHVALFELLLRGVKNLALSIMERVKAVELDTTLDSRPGTGSSSRTVWNTPPVQGPGSKALRGLLADDESTVLPSRINPLLHMADMFHSVLERQAAWKEIISTQNQTQTSKARSEKDCDYMPVGSDGRSPGSATLVPQDKMATASSLDDVLNQPSVSQLQQLIKQQQELQAKLDAQLEESKAPTIPRVTAGTQTDAPIQQKPPEAKVQEKKPVKENPDLQVKYQKLVRHMQHASSHSAIALADISDRVLERFAISIPGRAQLQPPYAEVLAVKMRALVAEVLGDQDKPKEEEEVKKNDKGKGKKSPEEPDKDAVMLAQLHLALHAQNDLVKRMVKAMEAAEEKCTVLSTVAEREALTLRCAIETEKDKVAEVTGSSNLLAAQLRETLHNKEDELQKKQAEVAKLRLAQQGKKSAVLRTSKDPPGNDAELKEMNKRCRAQELEINRISTLHEATLGELGQKCQVLDMAQRENSNFRKLLKEHLEEIARMKAAHEQLERELRSAADAATASDVRATKCAESKEADLDAVRKLSIELSICRNTIAGLRKREDQILKEAKESEWKCTHIKTVLDQERAKNVDDSVATEHVVERLKEAAEVSRRAEREARSEASQKQQEMHRLKKTEERLQGLQKDFRNYTMSKIRQGEATEEEERRLQECLVMLSADLFQLPDSLTPEDVELTIDQLEEKKRCLEAEQRQTDKLPQKGSALGQIVGILKRRMNAIQLYAYTEKKKFFAVDEELKSLKQVLVVCRSEQQVDMASAKESSSKLEATLESLQGALSKQDTLNKTVDELSLQMQDKDDTAQRLQRQVEQQQKELAETGCELEEKRYALAACGSGGGKER